ncbi:MULTISPECIES: STAS domain-containing protein [unclassified Prevotella]|uniref:STAS domain-containing protein n=1 Tax=unclassified Prevotella TaxID=2638335 RepID=UPI00048C011A|nr:MULTISPECIES: STAS domain-containing protein [unclassified Prevotella]
MKTTFKEEDKNFVMYFEGRLDTAASAKVEEEMKPLYNCDGHDVILDCTSLEYISSSGLRLFLGLLKAAKPKGSHVFLRGLNEDLRQVFAMTGFINLFEFK